MYTMQHLDVRRWLHVDTCSVSRCICDACCVVYVLSLICTRMTGVGGRPELIIEGANNLESDQWMVSAIQLLCMPRTSSISYIYLHLIIILPIDFLNAHYANTSIRLKAVGNFIKPSYVSIFKVL